MAIKEMTDKEKRNLVKEDYNAIAEMYAQNYENIDPYVCYIDEFISKFNGKKIVDVGCGAGQVSAYLNKKGFDVIGVDFSGKLLEIARKKHPQIEFIEEDICKWKPKDKFDGIITKDALCHIPDENLDDVLKNFTQILKRGGSLFIVMDIPKKEGEQILAEEFDENYKVYYNYMGPEKIKKRLQKNGFEIDYMKIIEQSEDAYIYASGLMIFKCHI